MELTLEQVQQRIAELFPDEEKKKEAIPQSDMKEFIPWLSSSSTDVKLKVAELIGDLARIKKNRKRLSRLSPIRPLLVLLQDQDLQLRKWAARALGNLSYDNEKMIRLIVSNGGVPLLIALIKEHDSEIQRNSAGALANLASLSQEEDINVALIGGGVLVPAIDLLSTSTHEMVQYMTTRLLSNLSDNDKNQREIGKIGGVSALVKLIRSTQFQNVKTEAMNALSYLTEDVQNCADFSKEGALNLFQELLNSDDEDVCKAAFEQLLALAQKEEMRAEFRNSGILQDLLHMAQGDDKSQKLSMAILSHLTLDEENMIVIFEHVDKLLTFLSSSDIELQLNAAMIFGNMARNDLHCQKLMDAGCVQPLIEMMSSKDHRVQHLATSAIRNLSIPADNKRKMVAQGALGPLIKLLTSQNAHVMFAGIGALKSLMMLPENRAKLAAEGGMEPLIAIKDAIVLDLSSADEEPDKDKPKDRRVQLEAARVLVLLSEEEELRDVIIEQEGFGLIAFMLESHFDILHLEATKGIMNLSEKENHRAALINAGILEPLVSLITRAETEKLQLATLHLLQFLTSDDKCKAALRETGVVDILELVVAKEATPTAVIEACHRLKGSL